jgi:hypothetical protein
MLMMSDGYEIFEFDNEIELAEWILGMNMKGELKCQKEK